MTGEALGARRGGLFPMLHAKGLIVRRRFHVVVVARRQDARAMVLMAESAVRHAEPVLQAMAGFVTANAIEHARKLQCSQAGAGEYGSMTTAAVQLLGAEMGRVRELDIRPRSPHDLAARGVLDLLRRMAGQSRAVEAAVKCGRISSRPWHEAHSAWRGKAASILWQCRQSARKPVRESTLPRESTWRVCENSESSCPFKRG